MSLFSASSIDFKALFLKFYSAKTEEEVDDILHSEPEIFKAENWVPLGGDEKMFGIVRNQQSNPIAALVEKLLTQLMQF